MAVINIMNKTNALMGQIEAKKYSELSLVEWRKILAKECNVYVCGQNYLGRRFNEINYEFCELESAKEIVTDNLYALLRFKYFTMNLTDTIDELIDDIVKSFTRNLKTTLLKVSFYKEDTDCKIVSFLDTGQLAFRNGVFDFRTNSWLFKYDINFIQDLQNTIYSYSPDKIITWYFNFNFEPYDEININDWSLDEFIEANKLIASDNSEDDSSMLCFKLSYNIAHDINHKYDENRMIHLCEILGFTLNPAFVQSWVMLVGSGSNGKNSLFDGCFSNKIIPRPASISLEDVENDRFSTGGLHNHSHNIYLEASAKTHTEAKVIKNLTGSPNQMIESKGIQKFNSILNVKNIFSCNSQDLLKFSDTSEGFRRRINLFEIYYHWDISKRFLKYGDYYDTTFSDDLHELQENLNNVRTYIYLGMYGILSATKNFTRSFKFTQNDWKISYSDIDFDLKDRIDRITLEDIVRYITSTNQTRMASMDVFYDIDGVKLQDSKTMKDIGIYNFDSLISILKDPEQSTRYFSEHDVYMKVQFIYNILPIQIRDNFKGITPFRQALKAAYNIHEFVTINKGQYIKVSFNGQNIKILKY